MSHTFAPAMTTRDGIPQRLLSKMPVSNATGGEFKIFCREKMRARKKNCGRVELCPQFDYTTTTIRAYIQCVFVCTYTASLQHGQWKLFF